MPLKIGFGFNKPLVKEGFYALMKVVKQIRIIQVR